MNTFVVSGLIKRRAQLAGDIEKAHFAVIGSQCLPTGVSVRSMLPVGPMQRRFAPVCPAEIAEVSATR